MEYISLDSHKRYTFASVEGAAGGVLQEARIEHRRGAIKEFLGGWVPGTKVAVETTGNWYWIVDEIEQAGMVAQLVHARRAKMMLATTNKTDRLDCHGLNRLQRTGTLPTVWIAPGEIRDLRDLPRTRMVLSRERTRLKNRIHATLAKYAVCVEGATDAFGKRGREELRQKLELLPVHGRFAVQSMLELLEVTQAQIESFEKRITSCLASNRDLQLLQSLPGVGPILATVILLEIGDIGRFASASHFCGYSGTTPRVHGSGDKFRYGQLRSDVNHYLKWAFIEAANTICLHRARNASRHVTRLYLKIRQRRGHQKAIGAVARHLAEATYWMLRKAQEYREPMKQEVLSTKR
jgi:transposase